MRHPIGRNTCQPTWRISVSPEASGHPSVYHHLEKGLVTLVHGDDYTTAGNIEDLRWFKKRLEEAYEIKTQMIGPDGDKIGKVLYRVITYTGFGFDSRPIRGTAR